MTHLLFECTHPDIKIAREQTLTNLHLSTSQLDLELHQQFQSLLTHLRQNKDEPLASKDSRTWAGAFHENVLTDVFSDGSTKNAIKLIAKIQKQTLPAVRYIWKVYCRISHPLKSTIASQVNSTTSNNKSQSLRKQTTLTSNKSNNTLSIYAPRYQLPERSGKCKKKSNPSNPATANEVAQPKLFKFFSRQPIAQTTVKECEQHNNPPQKSTGTKTIRELRQQPQKGIVTCWTNVLQLTSSHTPQVNNSNQPIPPETSTNPTQTAPAQGHLPYEEASPIKKYI